jgi:hypothetical protein
MKEIRNMDFEVFTKYNYGFQIEEDEMDSTRSIHGDMRIVY